MKQPAPTAPHGFIFPDAPKVVRPYRLHTLDPGAWLTQPKWAGYRCVIVPGDRNGPPTFWSRRGLPLQVSEGLAATVRTTLAKAPMLRLYRIDAELTGAFDNLDEALIAFDVLRYATAAAYRYRMLEDSLPDDGPFRRIQLLEGNLLHAYQSTYGWQGTEGIVIKHRDSTLRLGTTKSLVNPNWYKCKSREGQASRRKEP